jgi:TonB-dependent receptor
MSTRQFLAVAAAIAAASVADIQPAEAGELSGRVTDSATGRPLPNATVRVRDLGRSVTADRSGAYRIPDLPAGAYSVEAAYVGYEPATGEVSVPATGPAEQSFALAGSNIEEITVSGYRLSQATALQDKKSSGIIKESVTADDAGKLPDQNAAETLARVAGVAVTTDQGEGRYVTIRGIDAALNNVTLDSQSIGSPEGDTRRIALDTVPADLLAKLEVVKAVTPDMDGNAIGGSINIITPSAFDDRDGRFFSASADVGYYDLNEENPYGGSLAWGQTFGAAKQWGIVLSGSYLHRRYGSENVQGGDPWEEEGDFLVPDEFTLRDYTIQRVRKGFVANLEYRPSDAVKVYFRNLYNEFEDTELQPEAVFDYRNGDLENQTATSGTFTEGEAQRVNSERLEIQSIQSHTLGGEFTFGEWTLGLTGTYGETEQDTPNDVEWSFELDEVIPMTYDTSTRFFNVTAGPQARDASLFEFDQLNDGGQLIEEEMKIGQFELRRNVQWGDRRGYVEFGSKLVDRDQVSDQDMNVYDGFDGDLLLSQVMQPGREDFYSSERDYTFGPMVDFNAAQRFFAENAGGFELSDQDTIAESFGVDYTVEEKVTAGYVMGSLDIGRATFVGGVRVERTNTDFTGYDIVFVDGDVVGQNGVPPLVRGSKDFTNWLPGLQMRFAPQDDLIFRAAWTNTIGRPSYEQNVPFRLFEVEESDPDVFEGSLEAGNSGLDPLESMNLDFAVEWYLRPAGILSAGVFYKDIEHPIFLQLQNLEEVDFEGRFFSELEIEQPRNADTGDILGIELNFQQQFRTLPRPFDGLGIAIGYTFSDSEADVFDRPEPVPFFLQSDHIGNVSLFYERGGFEVRLGYAYRSEYLFAVGESEQSDLYIDTHGQLDLKASFDVTDNISAFFQMQNLTDEPLRYFSGSRSRMAENEAYSWNALAGVQVKF